MRNKYMLLLPPMVVLGASVWGINTRIGPRPHPFYRPEHGVIDFAEIQANGRLRLGLEHLKNHRSTYAEVFLDPATQKVVSQRRLSSQQWLWQGGKKATAPNGWRVVLPPPDGQQGDHVFGGHSESDENFSLNWLRLISPAGKVQVLKRLPQFESLCDLRFSPDGSELWALQDNALWRYNTRNGRVKRVVRSGNHHFTPAMESPENSREVWVNDGGPQTGAVLSPDGRFIVGLDSHSNSDTTYDELDPQDLNELLLFDAQTGGLMRRITLPADTHAVAHVFQARFTIDGQYLLLQGPGIYLRWSDKKRVGTYAYNNAYIESDTNFEPPPPLTADGRYFCRDDGADLVVRSVLNGQIVRRAKGALKGKTSNRNELPKPLVIAPDLSCLYFCPENDNVSDGRLWRWPLITEQKP